ncbi:MAG: hypothetical protein JSU04_19030 [Bdellovibrionales bacterium]|nr:hypothetical protein [Bdellovibrionales bacterium]
MKQLLILLILSFVFAACTSSTSSTSADPTAHGQDNPPAGPTPSQRLAEELTKTLASSYAIWQESVKAESTNLEMDYLLGFALRQLRYMGEPEKLLMVRADFKNRQGPQSEKDFLPLAKKILEKN